MHWYISILLSFLYIFLSTSDISAKVVVNEVLNNPSGNEDGAEWVELYNTDSSPASLGTCTLYLDASTASQKVVFDEEDFIDKFKVITWSSSWLSNSGDTVKIQCGSDSDSVAYGDESGSVVDDPDEGVTFGRSPDGIGNFFILSEVTMGELNSNPPTSTPNPTSTLTPTPRPSSTSTPTLTPKPITTPTNTPTIKPTIVPSKLPTDIPDQIDEPKVLGDENVVETLDATGVKVDETIDPENNKIPIAAYGLIIGGTIVLLLSLIPIFRNFKRKNVI